MQRLMIRALSLLAVFSVMYMVDANASFGQTTHYDWRQDLSYQTYCAELTYDNKYIGRVDLDYCRYNQGSEYEWRQDLSYQTYCAEVTSAQRWYIQRVDHNLCRYTEARYEWVRGRRGQYVCAEVDRHGGVIRYVPDEYCERDGGGGRRTTHLAWRQDLSYQVYCAEMTDRNMQVGRVALDDCRYEIGSRFEWRQDLSYQTYCAEVTMSEGWQIQRANPNDCRFNP